MEEILINAQRILLTLAMAVLLVGCSVKQQPPVQSGNNMQGGAVQEAIVEPQEKPGWFFHDIVDQEFVIPLVKVPRPEGTLLIDSRPFQPKHVAGHIPTSVSIPDSKLEKMAVTLPQDKSALLVFYCEGPT
jgi:hypothetical protein